MRGMAIGGALSAIDLALWDIMGKHFQAPVWQLLGGREDGVRRVVAAASHPNILVKISGFYYGSGRPGDYPHRDARWIVRSLYEALGAHRLCWGSDYPVVRRALTYRQSIEAFRTHCDFVTPADRAAILDAAPRLRFVGELEADRFARRIDVDAAAARGVKVVDTTHGSSYPVSEWALAMMLIGLRNAGCLFRRMIAGEIITQESKRADPSFFNGELSGKRVGLIACGHIGRRLLDLLRPFHCDILVHDPHVPRVLADIYDFSLTSLDAVMARSDVVVCLAPLTDETRGMANVFLTPHIAGVTADCGPCFIDLMVDEMSRFVAGDETRHDLRPRMT